MVETYKGVPVVERPMRLFYGHYADKTLYIHPNLPPKQRQATLEHEYQHHIFYTAHPWLEHHRFNTFLLWCVPVVAYYSPPYVFVLLLLPVFLEAAHELGVNYTLGDIGPRALIKACVCAAGIVAVFAIGMIIQRLRGVV